MKFLIIASMPTEAGNRLAKQGKLGSTIQAILESVKPESVYFAEHEGKRTAYLIVEMAETSQIPAIAEPFFLALNASVEFHPVMTPQDLMKAGPAIAAAVEKFA